MTSPASKHTECDHGPGHSCERCVGPKHDGGYTPTPWRVVSAGNIEAFYRDDSGEHVRWVCTVSAGSGDQLRTMDHANAAYIVLAANNHERLVEALKELLGQNYGSYRTCDYCGAQRDSKNHVDGCPIGKAEAALAAAQEGE